jgi:conjugative transfer signal peptidase TraF
VSRTIARWALRCLSGLLYVLAAGLLLWAVLIVLGLRYNHTNSFPIGLYWTVPKPPAVGDLVFWLPPVSPAFDMGLERRYFDRGVQGYPYEQLLKRLVAVEGDKIGIDSAGVTVNGRLLVNSKPLPMDGAGQPMPVLRLKDYRLAPGEVLLMSDYSPLSFDARYFGPIPRAQIQGVAWPVWTW